MKLPELKGVNISENPGKNDTFSTDSGDFQMKSLSKKNQDYNKTGAFKTKKLPPAAGGFNGTLKNLATNSSKKFLPTYKKSVVGSTTKASHMSPYSKKT
jgi:hypothetical protein